MVSEKEGFGKIRGWSGDLQVKIFVQKGIKRRKH